MSCENCLARRRSRMKEQQRKSEEEDAEAAIAKHEEDRSPAAGEENLGAAPYRCDHGGSLLAPGRATADLADVRGSRLLGL